MTPLALVRLDRAVEHSRVQGAGRWRWSSHLFHVLAGCSYFRWRMIFSSSASCRQRRSASHRADDILQTTLRRGEPFFVFYSAMPVPAWCRNPSGRNRFRWEAGCTVTWVIAVTTFCPASKATGPSHFAPPLPQSWKFAARLDFLHRFTMQLNKHEHRSPRWYSQPALTHGRNGPFHSWTAQSPRRAPPIAHRMPVNDPM